MISSHIELIHKEVTIHSKIRGPIVYVSLVVDNEEKEEEAVNLYKRGAAFVVLFLTIQSLAPKLPSEIITEYVAIVHGTYNLVNILTD